jgi:toxin ParE1/3/4
VAEIVYSAAARADLAVIWDWVAAQGGPDSADRLLDRIVNRIAVLAHYPKSGPERPDIGDSARMLVFQKYVVLYQIRADGVRVVRIVHGAINLDVFEWPEET